MDKSVQPKLGGVDVAAEYGYLFIPVRLATDYITLVIFTRAYVDEGRKGLQGPLGRRS
jgi:hypothetical protein